MVLLRIEESIMHNISSLDTQAKFKLGEESRRGRDLGVYKNFPTSFHPWFQLKSGEMRIQQLTSLLHESEAENAKLCQLADALKEEIRRSARNESREKHMENMEYAKNVILKVSCIAEI